jgi:sterol 3beta-glucosyltransferase/vancomycin aglycone glucosyltransferase
MRIALATVGTTGDVLPFAALARALADRGHEVTAISWALHEPAFAGSGARFEAAGPVTTARDVAETAAQAAAATSPTRQVTLLRDFHLRDDREHYRQLRARLEGHELAVIHGIHSLAQAAADHIGLPWASAVFDPVLQPTRSAPPAGMPNLGPLNPVAWRLLDRMLRPLDAPLHAVLAESGAATRPSLFRGRSSLLHLIACSPSIVSAPPDLPATTRVTGHWPPPVREASLPEQLEVFLADGAPPLIVTLGSMASSESGQVLEAALTAAAKLGLRVVVQHGSAPGGDQVLPVGEVEHRLLFPRAAAIVHHGGAGTTHAAVAAGVPSVVIPHVGDQRYWAARLQSLGVGATPLALREVTTERIVERLKAALQPATAERARRLGERVRAERGLETAVRLIEETVASSVATS